jgi:dihydrolipoamide dehydrogenase
MDTAEYDLVVVGSGSGLDVASAATNRGLSVAVIEKGPLGGTCLNRGCIPSKMLLYHAEVAETVQGADRFHVEASYEGADFGAIVREVTAEVDADARSIRRGVRSSPLHTLYEGEGRFVAERTLEVDGGDERVRGDQVLIAAGTRPSVPNVEGLADVAYLTSTEALRLEERPDSLAIVGGGYVAAELGTFFSAFGTDVTVIGRRPHLLPETDPEVGAAFTDLFEEAHARVHAGYEATAVATSTDSDGVRVEARRVRDVEGPDTVAVTAEQLLVATGRVPNSDTLNLAAAGVETDADGFVRTDAYLRTTAEGVWALGDIVGEYLLKHSANHEAATVARNLFADDPDPVDYTAMPYAVFASPEVAGVGATTDDLDAEGVAYATRTYDYRDVARGAAMQAEGFVKAIVDPADGTILGCHMVGPEASSLIHEVVVAMKVGSGTVRDIRDSVHVHPALNEVVQRAFLGRFTPSEGHSHSPSGAHDGGHDHDHDGDHDDHHHDRGHDHD